RRLERAVVKLVSAYGRAALQPRRRGRRGRLAVAERQPLGRARAGVEHATHLTPVEGPAQEQQPPALGEDRPAGGCEGGHGGAVRASAATPSTSTWRSTAAASASSALRVACSRSVAGTRPR